MTFSSVERVSEEPDKTGFFVVPNAPLRGFTQATGGNNAKGLT
jgi:hypothetical protein